MMRFLLGLKGRKQIVVKVILMLIALPFLTGCGGAEGPAENRRQVEKIPEEAKEGVKTIAFSDLEVPPKPKMEPDQLLAQGRQVYDQNCAVCHGATGDGKGEAAPFLLPKPRSFIVAKLVENDGGFEPWDAVAWESVKAHPLRPGTYFVSVTVRSAKSSASIINLKSAP